MPGWGRFTTAGAYFFPGTPRTGLATLVGSGVIQHQKAWPEATILAIWNLSQHGNEELLQSSRDLLELLEEAIRATSDHLVAIEYTVHYDPTRHMYTTQFEWQYETDQGVHDLGTDLYISPPPETPSGSDGDGGSLSGDSDGHWHHSGGTVRWSSEPADDGCYCASDTEDQTCPTLDDMKGDGDDSDGDIIAETEAGWVRFSADIARGVLDASACRIRSAFLESRADWARITH